jgi:2-polyprenyl-6-methoxyphenol hydroxylase-like FAD-dependent oxidoreductase
VPEITCEVDSWYANAIFERPRAHRDDHEFWLVFPTTSHSKGALVSPIEADAWSVSLFGRRGDKPPSTSAECLAHVAALEEPAIARLLSGALARSDVRVFHYPAAIWRRYDNRLPSLPPGLLPLGDTIASLNPLYGQGMSIAAWQAVALARALAQCCARDDWWCDFAREYLTRANAAVETAWLLGARMDRWSPTSGSGLGEVVSMSAAEHDHSLACRVRDDPQIHSELVRAWHLLGPATVVIGSQTSPCSWDASPTTSCANRGLQP